MQLIVFGATGQVGTHLVKQALWRGHFVKAYGRNVYEMDIENDKLEKIKAGLFDAGDVLHAIKGCDAVLSAIGGAFDGSDKARSLGIKTIVTQMQKAAVKRIIALGNMSILNLNENYLILDQKDNPK